MKENLRHDGLCQRRVIKHVGVAVKVPQKRSSHEYVADMEYLVQLRQNVAAVERPRKYATDFNFIFIFTMMDISYVCCWITISVNIVTKPLIINYNYITQPSSSPSPSSAALTFIINK